MTPKKILKIIAGILIFFTLPSLLFFGFIYLKHNEDLPTGSQPKQADILAQKMLNTLDIEAYNKTNYLEWTFKGRHHYKWNKKENTCQVFWKKYKVLLDLNTPSNSTAYYNKTKVLSSKKDQITAKALHYFNNDSFWLVAPYKVFDKGTTRQLVKQDGKEALLVTYTKGGSTPGDSYLWFLDENYKPTKFKMWVDILPIGGLEASWTNWKTTESNAHLPTHHKLMFLGLDMGNVKGTLNPPTD